ncbi:hypothetical protein LTR95_013379 [Oleoguttula sp. CCFEE 5521]
MSHPFHPPLDISLKGKVIVLTGGAIGIGAALVRLCHSAGAHVFFGDVLDSPGEALAQELHFNDAHLHFIHCDVTSYADNLMLFEKAFETCGRVDHAFSNAGIGEQENLIDPHLTLESVRKEPKKSVSVLDVNLKGPLYFARIASVYLRQKASGDGEAPVDKSLTFTSSVAGFREDPGLYAYVTSKHGVMGLMRSLRSDLSKTRPYPIRTNTVCPWMTLTRMVAGVEGLWDAAGLPSNTPEAVAKIMLGVITDPTLTGEAVYVEGGRGWKLEEGKIRLRPQWLGERQTKDLDTGTEVLGSGEGWIAEQA